MRVAILGATSMLASDFVAYGLKHNAPYEFALFARSPDRIRTALRRRGVFAPVECGVLEDFLLSEWDAIVNFVGVGDPARAVEMGADILRITREWDDRVIAYLARHPGCRYIFLSSGAAFGLSATTPTEARSTASFNINNISTRDYYGIAKFYAEMVHRANESLSIIDVRIFNYISEYLDIKHRFLVNDLLRSIKNGEEVSVDSNNIVRDYLGTPDLYQIMKCCLSAPQGCNLSVDAYSKMPISKADIIKLLQEDFGLDCRIAEGGINATGSKSNYFSVNKIAEKIGYRPDFSSTDTLKIVARKVLNSGDSNFIY